VCDIFLTLWIGYVLVSIMDDYLCGRLRKGRVTLFLGAGASDGSVNQEGESPPASSALAAALAREIGVDYEMALDSLPSVAAVARQMHRLGLTYATFDSALNLLGLSATGMRTLGVEGIIVDHAGILTLRHAVIADYLVRYLFTKTEVQEKISALLRSLARFPSPLRFRTNNLDYQVYTSLLNHKFLKGLFSSERTVPLSMYREFEPAFGEDGLFWLQYASYEFDLGKNYRRDAVAHIRRALQTYPQSFQVIHAFSNMHFSLAVEAADALEAAELMEQATEALEAQIAERPNDAYPFVTLCVGRVNVFRRWYPERLRDEAIRLTDRLRQAQTRFPRDEALASAIRKVGILGSVPERPPGKEPPQAHRGRSRK
jgi:hypothetical protein